MELSFEFLNSVNLAVNLILIGLILMVQFVHYPLFEHVGQSYFLNYINLHAKKITWLVAPLMLFELAICCFLCLFYFNLLNACIFVCVCIIWASTFFIQVPLHNSLQEKYDKEQLNKLIKSNWIRTISWTLKAILLASCYFF